MHSFKDGTNKTRDQRWSAEIFLTPRITMISSVIFRTSEQVQIISSVFSLLLVAVFQQHVIHSLLFGALSAILVLLPARQSNRITMVIIYFIPLALMIKATFFWPGQITSGEVTFCSYTQTQNCKISIMTSIKKKRIEKEVGMECQKGIQTRRVTMTTKLVPTSLTCLQNYRFLCVRRRD